MIILTLTYFRSTKNTHVYVADEKDAPIPQLYIRREAIHGPAKEIKVTIEVLTV